MNAFETSLAELRQWRSQAAETLAALRDWASGSRLIDEQSSERLAHLERRLATERLTIAFVGENSRGKGELINALFFAESGARLLPSIVGKTIMCPTEILWDESRRPSIRLLPSETRESPQALREFLDAMDTWIEVPLDPRQPQSLAKSCEVLLDAVDAKSPRWRYAVINLPHELLASGLVVLDTAGYTTLASEPELSFHRVPDAAAIVFMLSADGITGHDQALWNEHVATIAGVEATCFVALNKIDGLREGGKSEAEFLVEIDRQVRRAAETLRVPPTRICALSARQGLNARLAGDRDGLLKSRIYRLEQALARSMVHQRRVDHATAVRAEARGVMNEIRALLDSRLDFAQDSLDELTSLQQKNQTLVELLAKKAGIARGRLEQARATFTGLKNAHYRHADELARLLDPERARASAVRAREAVAAGSSRSVTDGLDQFFAQSRERLNQAIAVIREAKQTMAGVGRKFTQDYKIAIVEIADFGTERFLVELSRIEEHCEREFKGGSGFMLKSRKSLGTLFFDTVGLKVVNIFEIADRETKAWMAGFIRPLESQINAYQEQSNTRIEGMGRIQMAEGDLVQKMEELRKLVAELTAQRQQLEAHMARMAAVLEIEREPSLA
jgi:hypothetical protein